MVCLEKAGGGPEAVGVNGDVAARDDEIRVSCRGQNFNNSITNEKATYPNAGHALIKRRGAAVPTIEAKFVSETAIKSQALFPLSKKAVFLVLVLTVGR